MIEDPTFVGDWYRERSLGTGGFGLVQLWKNKKTNESVAIKKSFFLDKNANTDKQKERWRFEVNLMTNTINNENIVRTKKVLPESFGLELMKTNPNGLPLLFMEYCEGGDLRRTLSRVRNCCGLAEQEIRNVLRSLRNAISYLHDLKITHRDIKPENIVLKMENNRINYKLTDLGYAKALDKQSLNASLVGTIEYLAPELLHSDKYNCSVDYWSFGIIAFEVICGVRPFIPHASVAKWMLHVQQKKSENICITVDDKENYTYHSKMFSENFVSKCFQNNMEKWLMLALEWNPKQRGHVFEMKKPESEVETKVIEKSKLKVTFSDVIEVNDDDCTNGGGREMPKRILKIFSLLDEILNKKILTIFCMYTCTYLSYEIDENTKLGDLLTLIENDTSIPKEEIDFVLPVEQHIDKIEITTRPKDLYIENFYERPMLFVLKSGAVMSNDIKPILSQSITDILQEPKVTLKPHIIKRFISDSHYFVRNEQILYSTVLDGIKNYSLTLNDDIIKYKEQVSEMMKLAYGLNGIKDFYLTTLNEHNERLIRNKLKIAFDALMPLLDENNSKLEHNIRILCNISEKVQKRYESVLKRSREVIAHDFLKNINEDFFNLKKFEEQFDCCRHEIMNKKINEKSHLDVLQSVYQCLKKRDILLRDATFKGLQQHLIDIRIELDEIKKAISNTTNQLKRYKKDLMMINSIFHNNIWNLMEKQNSKEKLIEEYLPDIENIFQSLKINRENVAVSPPTQNLSTSFENTSALLNSLGSDFLCFGEGPESHSLIEDNETLVLATQDLLKDGFEIITRT